MADIGSVTVRVVPNAAAFTTDLTGVLTPGIQRLSDQISRQLSSGISSAIARAIQEGLRTGGAGAGNAGGDSGQRFADAFDRSVTTRITAALKALPDADIGINSTDADRKLAEIRTQLLGLSTNEIRARVGINDASAIAALAALQAELEDLAKGEDIRVRVNSAAALAELAKLKAELAGVDDAANAKGPGSVGGAAGGPSLLFVAIAAGATLVGPAVGAASAALIGFAGLAGTTALAIKGIGAEEKAGTPIGNLFTSQIGHLKTALEGYEQVAARGVQTGAIDSLKELNSFAPQLNPIIADLATHLGHVFEISTGGLISGLTAMEPLLNQTGVYAEQLATKFAEFAASPQFAQFLAYASQELPKVAKDVFDMGDAFTHVAIALQPLGDFLLTVIDDTSKAVVTLTNLLHLLGQTTTPQTPTGGGAAPSGPKGVAQRINSFLMDPGGVFAQNRQLPGQAAPAKPFVDVQQNAAAASAANALGIQQADKAAAAALKQAAAYGVLPPAYAAATAAVTQQATALAATTLQMQLQDDASGLLSAALDTLDGKNLTAAQAQNAYEQSLVGLAQGIANTGNAVTGLTSGAISNRAALLSSVQAAEQAAEAQGNAAGSSVVAKEKLAGYTAQIEANAVAHGLDKQQVQAFIDSVLNVNALKVKPTKLDVDTAAALAKLDAYNAKLGSATKLKTTTFELDTSTADAQLQNYLLRLARAGTVLSNLGGTSTPGGGLKPAVADNSKAAGGKLIGPGTGTSDSILINASNGEFVSTAKATAQNQAALEAGNRGAKLLAIPGYADGGIVTITPTASQAASASNKASSASASAAKAAATLAGQQGNIRFTLTGDLTKVLASALGSVSAVQSAMNTLINAVHSGIAKGVGSTALLAQLQSENRDLNTITADRAAAATRLSAATAKLAADQATFNQEKTTVSQATTSGFDLTTVASGLNSSFSPFGGGTSATPSGIISALTTNNAAEGKFAAQLAGLKKSGLNASLLQQIGEAGVSGGADAANGLAGAPKAQIAKINQLFGQSNSLGSATGTSVANALFGSTLNRDNASIRADTANSASLDKAAAALALEIAKQTAAGVRVDVSIGADQLDARIKTVVEKDNANLNHLINH